MNETENTTTVEATTEAPAPVRLRLFSAALSLACPGLGQLIQGRKVFALHLGLFALTLFILFFVAGAGIDYWASKDFFYFRSSNVVWVFCLLFAIFPFLAELFSALDAAVWQPNRPSPLRKPLRVLGKATVITLVLLIIVLPAISIAREAARRVQCAGNLKQIGFAFFKYHDEHKCLPPAYTVDENGKPLHSWRVLILPYLNDKKYHDLYKKIRLDEPWDSEYNRQFHSADIPIFRCPSSQWGGIAGRILPKLNTKKEGTCNYSVVIGPETAFPGKESVRFSDITDGTRNTILVVERPVPVCWMDPNNEIPFDTAAEGVGCNCLGIGSYHSGGTAHYVCADGRVGTVSDVIDPKRLRAALTKSGGEKREGL